VPFRKACVQSLRERIRRLKFWGLHPARQDWRERAASSRGTLLKASHDGILDVEAILDELEFGKGTLLTNMDHACKSIGCRVRENVKEITGNGFRPQGHRTTEFL
jgi:hypothetical protein